MARSLETPWWFHVRVNLLNRDTLAFLEIIKENGRQPTMVVIGVNKKDGEVNTQSLGASRSHVS